MGHMEQSVISPKTAQLMQDKPFDVHRAGRTVCKFMVSHHQPGNAHCLSVTLVSALMHNQCIMFNALEAASHHSCDTSICQASMHLGK